MSSYYDRTFNTIGGVRMFANLDDMENERVVKAEIEKLWKCEVKPFGLLCPVDFYALRDGLIVAVLELKSRSHAHDKYPTVYLNMRKWLALQLAQIGMGCAAIFLVKFTDEIRYIKVADIPTGQGKVSIGGTNIRVKSDTDIEPVIHVVVESMMVLK